MSKLLLPVQQNAGIVISRKTHEDTLELLDAIIPATFLIGNAMERVLDTLHFRLAYNWIEVLKMRRTQLEDEYHDFEETIAGIAKRHMDDDPKFKRESIAYLVPYMSELQDAIKAAIEGDNGAALIALATEFPNVYKLHTGFLSNSGILSNSRMAEHTRYIGLRLIELEALIGPSINKAWKIIYSELKEKSRRGIEWNQEEQRALDYFDGVKPHVLSKNQRNDWENQLRVMKNRVKKELRK